MATVIRKEIRKRGFFGWFFLLIFLAFNALMLLWMFSYWGTIGDAASTADSDAAKAGTAIGGAIGTTMLMFIWVCGSVITGLLALLTRGRKTIVEETTG
ncbi:hypothetical protein T8J41_13755 [Nitratireductor rhodophyticola]|uniref:hypothetical protein n=1 Tax=Nitratireductor rhodophyticola TaxID=2854036 RepID=UPI002AC99D25|nr:hypothetical protein [Nitratireductor rhodophyticola]WPZ13221.1 hypothetical protein T8J41_13755 [Nitratireductor rhodophyticola]